MMLGAWWGGANTPSKAGEQLSVLSDAGVALRPTVHEQRELADLLRSVAPASCRDYRGILREHADDASIHRSCSRETGIMLCKRLLSVWPTLHALACLVVRYTAPLSVGCMLLDVRVRGFVAWVFPTYNMALLTRASRSCGEACIVGLAST